MVYVRAYAQRRVWYRQYAISEMVLLWRPCVYARTVCRSYWCTGTVDIHQFGYGKPIYATYRIPHPTITPTFIRQAHQSPIYAHKLRHHILRLSTMVAP